ncbi:MAG: hypothetical protein FWE12_07130 [Oscillospiraceae bacterium]|nr:hypothetical protein [Oscillospiraceae bacterium]
MPNAIYYVSYKLKKGTSVPDFLLAAKALNDGYISKQKGYISWEQMVDGETWADMCTFETMEDLKAFEEASRNPSELAGKFYSFINLMSCKGHKFSVEKTYGK